MLINILIRMSGRHILFKRCYESILNQTYKNIRVIVSFDNNDDYHFIPEQFHTIKVLPEYKLEHFWNLYCNELKQTVDVGYFYFQDSDDYLSNPHVIQQLVNNLQDEPNGLIVQFLRNGKPKPNNHLIATSTIRKGMIGGGCLVLHSKHKDVADWQAIQAADYYWIRDVAAKVSLRFVPLVLQVAGNNGLHGKQEITQQEYERQYPQSPASSDEITYERSSE